MARPLVLALLFVSGATGLVYELVWSKRLANVLGSSGEAHAIVLAVFMGGLALGAWLFGRTADRFPRPVVLYGLLELFVGLYAFAFPYVLDALTGLSSSRLALAGLALLPPTLAMGGTVPVLTKFFTRALSAARSELAVLYALNSLGAAAGVLAAGLWLVPALGLTASERAAGVANLALALVAIAVGWGAVTPAATEVAAAGPEAPVDRAAVRIALVCVALTGFTSMLYEITWVRVLTIVIGGTTYAFTLILAAFILGIGLGSFWLARRQKAADELQLFARLQVALIVSVCLALPIYGRLSYSFLGLSASMEHTPQTWPLFQLKTFFVCCAVVVVPAFFIGASFPAAAGVALRDATRLGRQLGGVYLWNTVGTVSGSLLGGLWLLALVGLEGNFAIGIGANLAAAALAARRRFVPVLAAAAAVLIFSMTSRGWSTDLVTSGRYREWSRTFSSYSEFRAAVKAVSTVLYQGDDVFASVLVGQTPAGWRYLRINGKVDGSTGDDIDTMVLVGQLGPLLSTRPVKRVLLIGMGTGVTAGSILTHPVEHVDLVEISPKVIEASNLFAADTYRANEDPRLHIHIDDAKSFLARQTEKYDLIVSQPSNPWVSGVSGLYSRDFFEVAREHLADDGLIVQWIHSYESSRALLQLVVRTLRETFPHGTTWLGPADLILVSGANEPRWDFEVLTARFEQPRVKADLARARIKAPVELLARQVHSDEGMKRFAGEGPINTDDMNRLEFESPVAYFVGAFVRFDDERLDEEGRKRLALAAFRPELSCEEKKGIHEALAFAHAPEDPVLQRAAAEAAACAQNETAGAP